MNRRLPDLSKELKNDLKKRFEKQILEEREKLDKMIRKEKARIKKEKKPIKKDVPVERKNNKKKVYYDDYDSESS